MRQGSGKYVGNVKDDAARNTFSTLLYCPLTTISQTITAQTGDGYKRDSPNNSRLVAIQ